MGLIVLILMLRVLVVMRRLLRVVLLSVVLMLNVKNINWGRNVLVISVGVIVMICVNIVRRKVLCVIVILVNVIMNVQGLGANFARGIVRGRNVWQGCVGVKAI